MPKRHFLWHFVENRPPKKCRFGIFYGSGDDRVKKDAVPKHHKPFPVPKIHEVTLQNELTRLCKIGVLRKCSDSTWASPTFIIPKKNGTVRFISDFRYVNKCLIRKPYPIPKIADVLQKLEGVKFATSLDLNMGYFTVRLDPDSQKICTIITP